MLKFMTQLAAVAVLATIAAPADAKILSVASRKSSLGAYAEIIKAPPAVLDDYTYNYGQQGFNEAQGVKTSKNYWADGGKKIKKGTWVSSHMIFFNTKGNKFGWHDRVVWTFDEEIIAVMSDYYGRYEAASSDELGHPDTNYTTPFSGSGKAAPFAARGMEHNDYYYRIAPNKLVVKMKVSEPGDWIRVVTKSRKVPEPTAIVSLLGLGLVGLIGRRRRRAA